MAFSSSLYEKQKIYEEPIQLEFESIHCEDIGLYVIGKYPRLKFGNSLTSEDFNWEWYAIATLRLTFFNLINKKAIEIVKVHSLKRYFFNIFKNEVVDYYFKVTDLLKDDDWLTDVIYRSINEVNKDKEHPTLFNYIHKILDVVMHNHGEYKKPARSFLIELINQNAKNHSWIEIDKKKRFLGVIVNNNLKVSEIYIPKLNMQHSDLGDLYIQLHRSNKEYAEFNKTLQNEIEADFRRRVRSD